MPNKEYYWKNKKKLEKYREENKEKQKEYSAIWYKNNPHKKKICDWKYLGMKLREGED